MKWIACFLFVWIALSGCEQAANRLVVHPERRVDSSPGAYGLSHREVFFPAAGGVELYGWWVPGVSEGSPTLLYLHDGHGNIGDRVDLLRRFHERLGVNVFLFDYRGFGRSSGEAIPEEMRWDVRAARNLLRSRGWSEAGLILHGNGLGANLAVHAADERPLQGLVLEAVFPDLETAARSRHPLLTPFLAAGLRDRMDILAAVGRLQVPVLFLHGERDREVPISLGWLVYDACSAPKWFYTIPDVGHRQTAFSGGQRYWTAWSRFLEEVFPESRRPPAPLQ